MGLRGGLGLELLLIEPAEVDRVEQQRREAAIAHGVGKDAAGEGEQQTRRLGIEERRNLLVGNVADAEQAGEDQLDRENRAVVGHGLGRDLERDFMHVVGGLFAADVELNVDIGLVLPAVDVRRVGVLEREILHILRDQADLRLVVGAVRQSVGHVVLILVMLSRMGRRSGEPAGQARGNRRAPAAYAAGPWSAPLSRRSLAGQ